jgi:hypothetical protein
MSTLHPTSLRTRPKIPHNCLAAGVRRLFFSAVFSKAYFLKTMNKHISSRSASKMRNALAAVLALAALPAFGADLHIDGGQTSPVAYDWVGNSTAPSAGATQVIYLRKNATMTVSANTEGDAYRLYVGFNSATINAPSRLYVDGKLTINYTTVGYGGLSVGNSIGVSSIVVGSTGNINVTNSITDVGYGSGVGSFAIEGGKFYSGGRLVVGNNTGDTGTPNAENTFTLNGSEGYFESKSFWMGKQEQSNNLATINNGTFKVTEEFILGNTSNTTNTFVLNDGSVTIGGPIRISNTTNVTSTLILNGGEFHYTGSSFNLTSSGGGDTANLTIGAAATFDYSGTITIGTGNVTLNLDNAGTTLQLATNVNFAAGAGTTADLNISNGTVTNAGSGSLTFGNGTDTTANITVSGGGALISKNRIYLGNESGSTATLNIHNGGNVTATGTVYLTNKADATATLNITSGAIFNYGSISVGTGNVILKLDNAGTTLALGSIVALGATEGGYGDIELKNGTISMTGNFNAANGTNTNSTLNVSGGSLSVGNGIFIANGTGSTATLNVSGDGSVSAGSVIRIGFGANSDGTLNISGGSVDATAHAIHLANGTGSTATLNITGGSLLNFTNLQVVNGTGTIELNAPGVTITATDVTKLGVNAGSVATFNVTAGSYVSALTVGIGEAGTGTLNINGGSFTGNTGVNIANGTGGTGTLNVTEGSFSITNDSFLARGADSKGDIYVSGTGVVNIGLAGNRKDLVVGNGTGSVGNITVEGGSLNANGLTLANATRSQSRLQLTDGDITIAGFLRVGAGYAEIQVSGGNLTANTLNLTNKTDSSGIFAVSGSGNVTVNGTAGAVGSVDASASGAEAFEIRLSGSGELTIGSGTAGGLLLGNAANTKGCLTLSDKARLKLGGSLALGGSGYARVTMTGGTIEANAFNLGNTGGDAQATLSAGTVTIGSLGFYIGSDSSSTAVLTVGHAARITSSGAFTFRGDNTLNFVFGETADFTGITVNSGLTLSSGKTPVVNIDLRAFTADFSGEKDVWLLTYTGSAKDLNNLTFNILADDGQTYTGSLVTATAHLGVGTTASLVTVGATKGFLLHIVGTAPIPEPATTAALLGLLALAALGWVHTKGAKLTTNKH